MHKTEVVEELHLGVGELSLGGSLASLGDPIKEWKGNQEPVCILW
jgi:hypothetical protein